MNALDVARKYGGNKLSRGKMGEIALELVNSYLPFDEQLTGARITGYELEAAIFGMRPVFRNALLSFNIPEDNISLSDGITMRPYFLIGSVVLMALLTACFIAAYVMIALHTGIVVDGRIWSKIVELLTTPIHL